MYCSLGLLAGDLVCGCLVKWFAWVSNSFHCNYFDALEVGFHFFLGSIAKEGSGWVWIARKFPAEDDPESVADPTDCLVKVLGPKASTRNESNKEGREADQFCSEYAHDENHGVSKWQDDVDRPENEEEDAGAAIWRWKDLWNAVTNCAGKIAREQRDNLAVERKHHCRNGDYKAEENGNGIARQATIRILRFVISFPGRFCFVVQQITVWFVSRVVGAWISWFFVFCLQRSLPVGVITFYRYSSSQWNICVLGFFVNCPPWISCWNSPHK